MENNNNITIANEISKLVETNIKLWHEEDKARGEDMMEVAKAKKVIDKLNQERNDLIEKIDEIIVEKYQK